MGRSRDTATRAEVPALVLNCALGGARVKAYDGDSGDEVSKSRGGCQTHRYLPS